MSETNEALPDVFRVKCWSGQFAVFKELASGKYEMSMENDCCKSQEITNDTAAGYFFNSQETWVRVQA